MAPPPIPPRVVPPVAPPPPPMAPPPVPPMAPPPVPPIVGGRRRSQSDVSADTSVGQATGSGSDLFAQIEAQRKAREERAAAIERGEIKVADPREARERALLAKKKGRAVSKAGAVGAMSKPPMQKGASYNAQL